MVGVDPEKALGGEKPMFDFHFVEGSRKEALEKLNAVATAWYRITFSVKAVWASAAGSP